MLYEIGSMDSGEPLRHIMGPPSTDMEAYYNEFKQLVLPNTVLYRNDYNSFVFWLCREKGFTRPTITTFFYG